MKAELQVTLKRDVIVDEWLEVGQDLRKLNGMVSPECKAMADGICQSIVNKMKKWISIEDLKR